MNRIANFGSEMGNFVYIDINEAGWKENFDTQLMESLDIALESSAKAKFNIVN